MQIEIKLDGHCIQTASKQAYERMLSQYLKGNITDDQSLILEKQIEGMVFFLKYADFASLRAAYADLDGRRRHRVVLTIPRQFQDIRLTWDDQEVTPKWKKSLKDQAYA